MHPHVANALYAARMKSPHSVPFRGTASHKATRRNFRKSANRAKRRAAKGSR